MGMAALRRTRKPKEQRSHSAPRRVAASGQAPEGRQQGACPGLAWPAHCLLRMYLYTYFRTSEMPESWQNRTPALGDRARSERDIWQRTFVLQPRQRPGRRLQALYKVLLGSWAHRRPFRDVSDSLSRPRAAPLSSAPPSLSSSTSHTPAAADFPLKRPKKRSVGMGFDRSSATRISGRA